jgi:hypothetical protein
MVHYDGDEDHIHCYIVGSWLSPVYVEIIGDSINEEEVLP